MADASSIKIGDAYIEIGADDAKALLAAKQLESKAGGWGQAFSQRFTAGITSGIAALGIGLSAGALLAFGRSSVKAAAAEEQSQLDLASALKTAGQLTDENYDKLLRYAMQLSRTTSITHEQAEAVIGLGASFGNLSGKQLEDATRASIGWAKIMGTSAQDAMRMMMMAMRGGVGGQRAQMMFRRWGVDFGEAQTPEQRLGAMMPGGETGFARAEAAMSGISGSIDRAGKAVEEFKEQVGRATWESSGLGERLKNVGQDAEGVSKEAQALGDVLGYLAEFGLTLADMFIYMRDRLVLWAENMGIIERKPITAEERNARVVNDDRIFNERVRELQMKGMTEADARHQARSDTASQMTATQEDRDKYNEEQRLRAIAQEGLEKQYGDVGLDPDIVAKQAADEVNRRFREMNAPTPRVAPKLPGVMPKDLGEGFGVNAGEAGMLSASALAGASVGGVAWGTGGMGAGPQDRTADATERSADLLDQIATNTRKDLRNPYSALG